MIKYEIINDVIKKTNIIQVESQTVVSELNIGKVDHISTDIKEINIKVGETVTIKFYWTQFIIKDNCYKPIKSNKAFKIIIPSIEQEVTPDKNGEYEFVFSSDVESEVCISAYVENASSDIAKVVVTSG